MIFDDHGHIRLTKSERNLLVRGAAIQGEVVTTNGRMSASQLNEAALQGLPDELLTDMMQFFETGVSQLATAELHQPRVKG